MYIANTPVSPHCVKNSIKITKGYVFVDIKNKNLTNERKDRFYQNGILSFFPCSGSTISKLYDLYIQSNLS